MATAVGVKNGSFWILPAAEFFGLGIGSWFGLDFSTLHHNNAMSIGDSRDRGGLRLVDRISCRRHLKNPSPLPFRRRRPAKKLLSRT